MEEPSSDLEDRILSAVREQQKVLPFKARASSVLSRAGAWAMRPQTAMAAVFLLVIGTSFVLVQSHKQVSTASKNAEGMPMVQAAATASAATPGWALEKESAFAHGVEEKRLDLPRATPSTAAPTTESLALGSADGDFRERDKSKDEAAKNDSNGIANAGPIGGIAMNDVTTTSRSGTYGGQGQQPGGGGGGGASAPNMPMQQAQQHASTGSSTALAQAKAQKQQSGCTPAVAGQFDQLRGRADVGGEATLEAARCYRALGNSEAARSRYSSLLQNTPYAQTAQNELDQMTPAAAAARKSAMPRPVAVDAQMQQAAPPTATATSAPQAKPAEKGASSY
jgi:hypothetical protein